MGDGHYVYPNGGALVVSLYRAGFVLRSRCRLVSESSAGPPAYGPSRVDGGVAAAGPHVDLSSFRSWVPVYVRRVPAILGGASHHLQHERRRQLCG